VKAIRPPSNSLRARQKASTGEIILEAVARCLKDTSLADLNFSAIAREAGIGERTIYRHFSTKEVLLDAFWAAHMKAVHGPHPQDAKSLLRAPIEIFPGFDLNAEVTRGLVTTVQGRAIAQRANKSRVAAFRSAVRDAVGDLSEARATRLCASVQSLLSAGTWLQMREFWGLSGEEAGLAVQEAIEILLAATRLGKSKKSRP
jgi:AcrR family transcriptional regulator